ncbi:MAG: aspartyl/asparaginyl beta-hydroxylase domain-containing protein [Verrucomicrobiae bacterium]|nr:aspartyl/asparaginyl beta-hydroxylase domain-containing protein [Verrucomicrobiae bacterium]
MIDFKDILIAVNRLFEKAMDWKWFPRTPLFWTDYHETYPHLSAFEQVYPKIRREVEEFLKESQKITDVKDLAGKYTAGGIHTIEWKSYLLKLGKFVEENCKGCPETAKALSQVPRVHVAFFSILFPGQYIKPHFGYYKGFLRYHLGIIIPQDYEENAEPPCWLRINDDPMDNRKRDKTTIERGEKYHWKEGKGVMFDDTLLHDASNQSDQIRVVLWLDVRRPMPRLLDWLHGLFVRAAMLHPFLGKVRKNATIEP